MSNDTGDVTLEGLRKQAKRWLRSIRHGDATALRRLEAVLPKHSPTPGLREVQQAVARERGYESWAALKDHMEIESLAHGPGNRLTDEFLQKACIFSGGALDFPHKWRRAERIRVRHPQIARENIHTAVVCGEIERVRALLQEDPSLVTAKGGPQQWDPLLYACYGRLPNETATAESLAIAEFLLDAGADPNASFVMSGQPALRFSALTGAMGHGEMAQPEHPQAEALARMLLERGASPNDSQGLYNTHLEGDDPQWLNLLLDHGLSKDDPTNWDVDPPSDPQPIVDYLLAQAATNGHIRRLRTLLSHQADPNARSIYNHKTAYQCALLAGHQNAADLLLEFGAHRDSLEGHDRFASACHFGDWSVAHQLAKAHPEYLAQVDLLVDAAGGDRVELVEFLLRLGIDPNKPGRHGHRALNSAWKSEPMCQALLAEGADPRARAFGGTPQDWARLGGDLQRARWLAEQSRYILDAVASGHVVLVAELLHEDPQCANATSPTGDTALHALPTDVGKAEQMLELLSSHALDLEAQNHDGKTPREKLIDNGADDVALLLEAAGADGP